MNEQSKQCPQCDGKKGRHVGPTPWLWCECELCKGTGIAPAEDRRQPEGGQRQSSARPRSLPALRELRDHVNTVIIESATASTYMKAHPHDGIKKCLSKVFDALLRITILIDEAEREEPEGNTEDKP